MFSRKVVDEISSKPTKHIEVLRILLLVQMICYPNLLHRLTSYQSNYSVENGKEKKHLGRIYLRGFALWKNNVILIFTVARFTRTG